MNRIDKKPKEPIDYELERQQMFKSAKEFTMERLLSRLSPVGAAKAKVILKKYFPGFPYCNYVVRLERPKR